MTVRVALEVSPKRAFASALAWPGWSRGARTADEALQALLDYAPRYAPVAGRAKVAFSRPATLRGFDVVETLEGSGSTEFGIPGAAARSEDEPITPGELKRLLALLRASWGTLDAAAATARGVSLRLGPRGGGRQVPKILDHVHDSDAGYLTQLGSKAPGPDPSRAEMQRAFVEALAARAEGRPLADPNKVRKPWSPRYAIRRTAWHALDHAWEIEDRSPHR